MPVAEAIVGLRVSKQSHQPEPGFRVAIVKKLPKAIPRSRATGQAPQGREMAGVTTHSF